MGEREQRKPPADIARQKRLETALRENLKRRKAQARARKSDDSVNLRQNDEKPD